MGVFYVKRSERLFGPATVNELIDAAATGLILPTDLIGPGVDGPWRDAARCVELSFEQQAAPVYFWQGEVRRGPIALEQLSRLLEWNVVALDTQAYSEPGGFTSVGELLGLTAQPGHHDGSDGGAESSVTSAPEPQAEPDRKPAGETTGENPAAQKAVPRSKKSPRRGGPVPESGRPPKGRGGKPQKKATAPSRFELLVQMEQDAERDDSPVQTSRTRGRKRRGAGGQGDGTRSKRRIKGDPNYYRAVNLIFNSPSFAGSYQFFALMLSIQTACFLAAFAALAGAYFSRIFFLAVEVFVPIGSTGRQLQEAELVEAGFACVMIGAEIVLPLVFLIKGDQRIVWWAGATAVGLLMFPVLSAGAAGALANVLGFLVLGCGVALAFAVWSIAVLKWNARIVVTFSVGALATAALACFLAVIRVSGMFRADVDGFPPTLASIEPSSSMVLLILCVQWLVGPVLVGRILRENTDSSTRRYIDYHLRGAGIAIAAAWLLYALCAHPGDMKFISVPVVLLSWTALAVVASVLQSVVWNLRPELIGRR